MNKETYEALKRIVKYFNGLSFKRDYKEITGIEKGKDIFQVMGWIDEVAKDYQE